MEDFTVNMNAAETGYLIKVLVSTGEKCRLPRLWNQLVGIMAHCRDLDDVKMERRGSLTVLTGASGATVVRQHEPVDEEIEAVRTQRRAQ